LLVINIGKLGTESGPVKGIREFPISDDSVTVDSPTGPRRYRLLDVRIALGLKDLR